MNEKHKLATEKFKENTAQLINKPLYHHLVWLTKKNLNHQGPVVQKPICTNPGLNI